MNKENAISLASLVNYAKSITRKGERLNLPIWPKGQIPYKLEEKMPSKVLKVVKKAIEEWNRKVLDC